MPAKLLGKNEPILMDRSLGKENHRFKSQADEEKYLQSEEFYLKEIFSSMAVILKYVSQ